jgi:hypothetical protein
MEKVFWIVVVISFFLVGLFAACSRPPEKPSRNEQTKQASPQATGQGRHAISNDASVGVVADAERKSPPGGISQPSAGAGWESPDLSRLTKRELEKIAMAAGVAREQVLPFFQKQTELWRMFNEAIESPDKAVQIVPMMLKLADTLQAAEPEKAKSSMVQKNGQQKLPDGFLKMRSNGSSSIPGVLEVESPEVKMMRAGFMGIDVEKLAEQHVLGRAVHELARLRPGHMVLIAKERAKVVPPTAADYIIYAFIFNGIAESPYLESADSKQPRKTLPDSKALLDLSTAPNPIYRLLSAELAMVVESEPAKLIEFYRTFLSENDPVIQTSAVWGLRSTRSSSAVATLQEFESGALRRGESTVASAARRAIEGLRSQ